MTKEILNYYVTSKEELWLKCHMNMLGKFLSNVRPIYESSLPPDLKLFEMIKAHVQNVISGTTKYTNYSFIDKKCISQSIQQKNLICQKDEFEQMFTSTIKEGIKSEIFYPVDVDFAKLALMGAMNYITNWYSADGELSPLEISERIADFVLSGFLARPVKYNGDK